MSAVDWFYDILALAKILDELEFQKKNLQL